MLDDFNPDTIQDLPAARAAICHWLNLVESIAQENRALKAENQSLRDEINRLKGEQGKPDIKPQKAPATAPPHRSASNHSSETARQELGTTQQFHFVAPNPWVIIGVLPIPHERQLTLFES